MTSSLFHKEATDHILYSPVQELTDEQLVTEISSMENARLAPRKNVLRQERIQRQIIELGLAQTEVLLGLEEMSQDNG